MAHVDDASPVFNPDGLQALTTAFDAAWASIPNHFRNPERLREMLATQIVELAARGEHRPEQLSSGALRRVFSWQPEPADGAHRDTN